MVFRLMTGFNLVALSVLTGLATGTSAFAGSGVALASANLQDDSKVLPQDNAVTFVNSDRRVRLQLVSLADSSASMVGTPITVISPAGEATRLTADAQGVVILSDVQAGLHAVVSAGTAGHVAVPLVLREVPEEHPAGDASTVSNARISTVQLPLIHLDPREVVRVANSFLAPAAPAGTPAAGAAAAALDSQLIASGEVAPSHRYRIQLADSGRIEGRIYSLMSGPEAQVNLAGTNLMVYSGNRLVARATTDDQGRFVVENLRPGIHGLIAAGPAGYSAFAFDVYGAGELVDQTAAGETLVSTAGTASALVNLVQPPAGAGSLPVVVIPPPMVPSVVDSINQATPPGTGLPVDPTVPGFAPVPGGGFAGGAGGAGGGFGGGGGGLGGAAGGLGGAGGLLALGGVAAAVAAVASDSDDRPIVLPPVATPAEPGPPSP